MSDRRDRASRRRWILLGGLFGLGIVVHALGARALIDHGVAGALLAGGGGWTTVIAAASLLLLRLVIVVGLASLPAVALALIGPRLLARARVRSSNGS